MYTRRPLGSQKVNPASRTSRPLRTGVKRARPKEGLRMNHRCALQILAGVVLLAATLSTPSLAQPSMSRVTITHVRPDMLTEWVDLQKNEVVPALKKAGEKTRTVYVSGLFRSSYEYVIITPIASFAQFDGDSPILKTLGPVPAARLGEKLRKCTVSSDRKSTRLKLQSP